MNGGPLIGVTGRCKTGRDVDDLPPFFDDLAIDMYFANYAGAVVAAGGLAVNLPSTVSPPQIVEHLDGLLLTGGSDIEPSRYGAETEAKLYGPEPERDEFEFGLLKAAVQKQIPVLGICRGQQVVNVGFGGTLHQDVPSHSDVFVSPENRGHEVATAEGSVLRELYGPALWVNSIHHQAVDVVGDDLQVTGRSQDNIIEGLQHESLPIVCVQWHPEILDGYASDPLFSWFVDRATQG